MKRTPQKRAERYTESYPDTRAAVSDVGSRSSPEVAVFGVMHNANVE